MICMSELGSVRDFSLKALYAGRVSPVDAAEMDGNPSRYKGSFYQRFTYTAPEPVHGRALDSLGNQIDTYA
ncbi:MAG: hypothetical protein AABX53_00905 [Nanoarchaeota archaeon]